MEKSRARIRQKPPIDGARLEEMAIAYVGRYASTRTRLRRYLDRKLRERGWAGEAPPPIEAIVERCASLGYVDDAAYAAMKARDLTARGYGARRVDQALYGAGIDGDDGTEARRHAEDQAAEALLAFARRRRFGPFALEPITDPALRQKQYAAMLRAGHGPRLVGRLLDWRWGEEVGPDDLVD